MGCNTREENAAELAIEEARQTVIDALVTDAIEGDNLTEFVANAARFGIKGFEEMSDDELARKAREAGIQGVEREIALLGQ